MRKRERMAVILVKRKTATIKITDMGTARRKIVTIVMGTDMERIVRKRIALTPIHTVTDMIMEPIMESLPLYTNDENRFIQNDFTICWINLLRVSCVARDIPGLQLDTIAWLSGTMPENFTA
mmetsp:Transcript_24972/g.34734  ORF Transcript_24972/g.34734 Transcript_24972/m.34734 type:complete len:122 (-) Transcript_24972:755-1120(-)